MRLAGPLLQTHSSVDIRPAGASSFLRILRCPYCGAGLEEVLQILDSDKPADAGSLVYGLVRCECAEFPVLEGIPILQHVEGLQRVVQLLKQRNTRDALLEAMSAFRAKWAHRTRLHQISDHLNCRRVVAPHLTFEDALRLVRKPRGFADYLFHRYANPSFLADVALLPVLAEFVNSVATARGVDRPRPRVLDLGCGAGHTSYLITSLLPDVSVVASDHDFVSLYLAKRFLAPTARYVCTDVEVPSPFPDSYFDAVHCLDAFHYFRSKRAIVAELRRVLKAEALWLFPHLHNALEANVTAGTPLSPDHYARCFEFLNPTLFDEAELLRHLGDVRMARRYEAAAAGELRSAQAVALIGGGGRAVAAAEALTPWLCRAEPGLQINPIYEGRWQRDTLELQLRWPSEGLHEECRAVESVLPQTCELTKADLEYVRIDSPRAVDSRVYELVSRFVLVPLPPNYSPPRFDGRRLSARA